MSPEERKLCSHSVILKISAITGWTIPATDQVLDILIDQFEKKLNESYRNVNEPEVEYAFRNRGIDVKDWGKALNLTMIDEVLIPYLETRFELSRAEESLSHKKQLVIDENKELSDTEMAEWLMDWKSMDELNIDLIPIMFYEFLDSKKIINLTNAQKWEYTSKGVTYVKAKLQDEIGNCKTNDAYLAYNKFQNQESIGFDKEFAGRIKNRAKRLIVYDYLKDKL